MSTFKEHSKQDWNSSTTTEHINAGSLQRIADATEKMASNYVHMESDLKFYKERCEDKNRQITTLEKRNAALRGVINRMKKLNKPHQ